jgi:putative peptide zinc metalloprotease protein
LLALPGIFDMAVEALSFQSAVQKINLLDERKKDRFIISTQEGRSFVVGDAVLTVLHGLTKGMTASEIAVELNKKNPAPYYDEQKVLALVTDVLLPKGLVWKKTLCCPDDSSNSTNSTDADLGAVLRRRRYVRFPIRLFQFNEHSSLLKAFSRLCSPEMAIGVGIIAASLMAFAALRGFRSYNGDFFSGGYIAISAWPQVIAATLAIILFHELGHAAAAYRAGIKRLRVGIAFYLIMPVFYTDVTRAWGASRSERLMIDAAGVYFQSIVTACFAIASLCDPNSLILWDIVFLSGVNIIFSISPFLRSDGYWFFCDYFNVPNMRGAAVRQLRGMLGVTRSLRIVGECASSSSKAVTTYLTASILYAIIGGIVLLQVALASVEAVVGGALNGSMHSNHGLVLEMLNGAYSSVFICAILFTVVRYALLVFRNDSPRRFNKQQ